MKTPILRSKYRMLVLMDLSKASYAALQNAVNLAKLIDGSIEVFHVKSPTDVVKHENQISAMWAIDKERSTAKKKLEALVNNVADQENIPIIYNFIFGNVKHEVKEHIKKTNPDIVVMGKRKQKLVNFIGDGLTQYVLNNYNGGVFITGKDTIITPHDNLSLGFFNETGTEKSIQITEDLKRQSKNPVKLFYLRKNTVANISETKRTQPEKESTAKNTITYEFEEGTNAIHGIISYISKNNIELLCMDRGNHEKNTIGSFNRMTSNIKEAINKINVPILVLNNQPMSNTIKL